MGNFSRDTFDGRKHYAGVRLQQGVPLVDADWNEKEDVRRAELRDVARSLVGSGVPLGSDGFRVTPAAAPNDFGIAAGRCLVEGWDAVNDWDERGDGVGRTYASQPLFGNAALAAAWGVAPLPPLTTPSAPRTDRVYLDVWEREVDADEDPELVDPHLGVEGCVRVRREWVVRVAEGAAALPAPPAGHAFHELATLSRPAGSATVTAAQVTDLRRTGLGLVPEQHLQQIAADAFGPGYTLDGDGQPNLKVSLREAVNALMRGQLPGTPPQRIGGNRGSHNLSPRCTLRDRTGKVWVFWVGHSTGPRIWYNRYDPAARGWDGAVQLSSPQNGDEETPISVVQDREGMIWVFWTRKPFGQNHFIAYNRFDPASGAWRGEARLTTGSTGHDRAATAVVDSRGGIRVFWQRAAGTAGKAIWHSRYDPTSRSWTGEAQLSTGTAENDAPTAVVDGRGDVWVVWTRMGTTMKWSLWCNRYDQLGNAWTGEVRLTTDAASNYEPYLAVDSDGWPWIFWTADAGGTANVYCRRYTPTTAAIEQSTTGSALAAEGGAWGPEQRLTADGSRDSEPTAVGVKGGEMWLFWVSRPTSTSPRILGKRYTRDGGWGSPVQLSTEAESGLQPVPLLDAGHDIWVVMVLSSSIWYRRLVTAI